MHQPVDYLDCLNLPLEPITQPMPFFMRSRAYPNHIASIGGIKQVGAVEGYPVYCFIWWDEVTGEFGVINNG